MCPYEKPFGYIYMLTNKFNGHKYIGKHVFCHPYLDESYWGSGGRHLENAKKTYGFYDGVDVFDRIILQWVGTNDEDLKIAEKTWISLFKTHVNPDHYNETPGGEGFDEFTPQMKQRWRDMVLGDKNPMYGIHLSGEKHPLFGTHLSQERKEYLSKKFMGENNPNYGNHKLSGSFNPSSRKIVQLDMDGEFVKEYSYMKEVSEYGFDVSNVRKCCKGVQMQYLKFRWMYIEDYEIYVKTGVKPDSWNPKPRPKLYGKNNPNYGNYWTKEQKGSLSKKLKQTYQRKREGIK